MDVFDELDDAGLTDLCVAMTTDQRRHAATSEGCVRRC